MSTGRRGRGTDIASSSACFLNRCNLACSSANSASNSLRALSWAVRRKTKGKKGNIKEKQRKNKEKKKNKENKSNQRKYKEKQGNTNEKQKKNTKQNTPVLFLLFGGAQKGGAPNLFLPSGCPGGFGAWCKPNPLWFK